MALDQDTVRRVATLARIKIEDKDLAPMVTEISAILGWIEQLNDVNTDGVAPLARVVNMTLPMRDDVVTEADQHEKIMKNAPQSAEGRFFTVPKVVE